MGLTFEQGESDRPRGHAVLYFRDRNDPSAVAATYIVILPVAVDIARYVPPFLAGQVGDLSGSEFTTFAFPPAPERVSDPARFMLSVEARADDLIFGGHRSLDDMAELLGEVGEIVAEYAGLYESAAKAAGEPLASPPEAVDDLVYELMGEADKLTELTTLTGRLRFASEGGDAATATETATRIRAIARHLPENRRVERMVEVASFAAPEAADLVHLYLERAYCLLREDYLRVKALEEKIARAEASLSG